MVQICNPTSNMKIILCGTLAVLCSSTIITSQVGVNGFDDKVSKRHLRYDSPAGDAFNGTCYPTAESDWTYNYACKDEIDSQVAPDQWYTKYADCNGTRQSPINFAVGIITPECPSLEVKFNSGTCTFDSLEYDANIKTWSVAFGGDGCTGPPSIEVDGIRYVLSDLHIHSESEHTIGGGHADAELHLVHANENNDEDLIVIAVLLSSNSDYFGNEELDNYWYRIADAASDDDVFDISEYSLLAKDDDIAEPYDILPASGEYYTYIGSLTAPPCSEIVTWVVMTYPVLVSPTQLELFRSIIKATPGSLVDKNGNTARPIQSLNGRIVSKCNL